MRRRAGFAALAISLALICAAPAGAAGPAKREMIDMRQKFFGPKHVDARTGKVAPGKVVLSWAGVSTFAASIAGHVVLLDAFVPRAIHDRYVPASPEQLAALRPEAIFVGHSHFDHALHAGQIAAASGATVVGTEVHCADAHRGAPLGGAIDCKLAVAQTAAPGETRRFRLLRGVRTTAVRSLHSPGLSPTQLTGDPEALLPAPGDAICPPHLEIENPMAYPPSLEAAVDEAFGAARVPLGDGGVVLYRFAIGRFSLAWQDSSASLVGAPELDQALRRLPPSDVFSGSISSLNQAAHCMRDPRLYADALRPKVLVPSHHDSWAPFPLAGPGRYSQAPLRDELKRMPAARRPCIRFLSDPEDYVRPQLLTFPIRRRAGC